VVATATVRPILIDIYNGNTLLHSLPNFMFLSVTDRVFEIVCTSRRCLSIPRHAILKIFQFLFFPRSWRERFCDTGRRGEMGY
jgi:hypothetical protein